DFQSDDVCCRAAGIGWSDGDHQFVARPLNITDNTEVHHRNRWHLGVWNLPQPASDLVEARMCQGGCHDSRLLTKQRWGRLSEGTADRRGYSQDARNGPPASLRAGPILAAEGL